MRAFALEDPWSLLCKPLILQNLNLRHLIIHAATRLVLQLDRVTFEKVSQIPKDTVRITDAIFMPGKDGVT